MELEADHQHAWWKKPATFSLDVSEGGNTLGVLEGGEMFRMFIEGEERRGSGRNPGRTKLT